MSIFFITLTIIIIALFYFFFYRYPTPIIRKNNQDKVYSPGFGKIMKIIKQNDNTLFIAIFLSPLDVHYQYYPISGTIKDLKYDHTGNFNLAYELNKSNNNEKIITTISNKHGNFIIYQIAGYLVRRITQYGKVNQQIDSGEPLGLIHFGSRVDIIIPNASQFNLQVKEGQYMYGFKSLLGYYNTIE